METANAKMIEKNTFIYLKYRCRQLVCVYPIVVAIAWRIADSSSKSAVNFFVRRAPVNAATFVQEGYPRHPKGALLAKQLRNVN